MSLIFSALSTSMGPADSYQRPAKRSPIMCCYAMAITSWQACRGGIWLAHCTVQFGPEQNEILEGYVYLVKPFADILQIVKYTHTA